MINISMTSHAIDQQKGDHLFIDVYVKTNAKFNKIKLYEDGIDVWVKSAPVRGKANREVIEFLARILDKDLTSLEIVQGKTSSRKVVRILNINADEFNKLITKYLLTQKTQ